MNIKIICTLCICYTAFVKVQKNVGIIEGNTLNICWFPSFRKVEYLKCKILCTYFDSWQIDCVDFTNRGIILATDIIFDKSCRSYSGTIISTWAIIKGPAESWWHGCNWMVRWVMKFVSPALRISYTQSQYREVAQGDIFMEQKMWFVLHMSNFWECFFMF